MCKILTIASLLALLSVAGCENVSAPRTSAGTPLGDTGVRVTGTVQAGASSSLR